ncbi:MAG: S8 family serine peptidase [Ignavibacteriales bacterium]|nr:S8 family serine peptidase [Ignavibacteriales bacterium]
MNNYKQKVSKYEIIIKIKNNQPIDQFFFKDIGLSKYTINNEYLPKNYYVLNINDNNDIIDISDKLIKSGYFQSVEPNLYGVYLSTPPNDQLYGNQWNLNKIEMEKAWMMTSGNNSVKIAVTDNGADYDHPDIINNKTTNNGYNFFNSSAPYDPIYYSPNTQIQVAHGTNCAGIISASINNNATGLAGIAGGWTNQGLELYHYFVADPYEPSILHLVRAIERARTVDDIKVISISLGFFSDPNDILLQAIRSAKDDIVMVVASGNYVKGLYESTAMLIPAIYSEVIAVGATTENDIRKKWDDSTDEPNWGSCYDDGGEPTLRNVDVMAPGIHIPTTDIRGQQGYSTGDYNLIFHGTSAAAPHVAALAGLILSLNMNLNPQQVATTIKNSCDNLSHMNSLEYGNGRINAYKALKYTLEHYGGTVTQNLTIPAGETWSLEPGVILTFTNDAKIIVNGTLNIVGTASNTITLTSSTNWGGIEFKSGSSGNISHTTVENATFGIYGDGVMPNIYDCEIKNNSYGIFVKNVGIKNIQTTLVENNYIGIYCYNADPLIEDCKISNNSYGISLINYSSPVFYYNSIKSNTYNGIGTYSDSHPYFGETHTPYQGNPKPGYNRLTNNGTYGLYSNNCSVFMGMDIASQTMGGYNSIFSNGSYEIYATNSSTVDAYHNYWNTSYPLSDIYKSSNSIVNWYIPLPSDPGGGSSLGKQGNTNSVINEYDPNNIDRDNPEELKRLALYYKYIGDYEESIKIFEEIMDKFPESDYAYNLVGEIYDISKRYQKLEIESYCDNKLVSLKTSDKVKQASNDVKIAVLLRDGKIKEAEDLSKDVIKKYPNTKSEKKALFTLYLISKEEETKKTDYLSQLKEKYPNEPETLQAMEITEIEVEKTKINELNNSNHLEKEATEKVIHKYELLGNYPNPFNPSTTISYSIPAASNISLTIYDMMGRRIESFEKNGLAAGIHSEFWDGRNENGELVSSGIYIYKFRAISQDGDAKVFEKSNKLMLLK